jgi:hypothetical protein
MSLIGFVIVTGGLTIAVIFLALYIFPNIICNYIAMESDDDNNKQQEDNTANNTNPLKEICAALSLKDD